METSFMDDPVALLEAYKKLKKDFEDIKQGLHEATRQIKVKDALIYEYQGEIDILQQAEGAQRLKYESSISSLEESIANIRSNNSANISYLESQLLQKDDQIENLKCELEQLNKKCSIEENLRISMKINETAELSNETELLKENYKELQEAFEDLHVRYISTEKSLQEYKEEINEFRESLKCKKDELLEKSALIDKLNDELLSVTSDLEKYKNKPLDDGSKGNSLFAEVDDRRVHLQKTVNDMKSNYIHLKQEYSKHEKIISHLRKENSDLRALWKKDLEQIQEDHDEVVDTLSARLKVLEEINNKQKQEAEERPKPPSDDLGSVCQFYEDTIESKCIEIKKLEKRLADRSVTEHMLSVSLAQAHKELRLLRLTVLDLRSENKEN